MQIISACFSHTNLHTKEPVTSTTLTTDQFNASATAKFKTDENKFNMPIQQKI